MNEQPPNRAFATFLKENADTYVEIAASLAKIRYAHFRAYIAEGFSEADALELCKFCVFK